MIVDFVDAKAKCDRAIALKAAYEWGETVRANGSSLMMEHALFIAQYGIDQEAQIYFEAGYAGIAATELEQVKKAIMQRGGSVCLDRNLSALSGALRM